MRHTLSCLFITAIFTGCVRTEQVAHKQDTTEKRIEQALEKAGNNRAELENALSHYTLKLEAARFLIANMEDQGFAELVFKDSEGNIVPYDALEYKNFKEGLAALEELEKQHGSLEYKKKEFVPDVQTINAKLLTENIELAFWAWQTKPWAKDLSWEAFRDYVLPYRGSNEPLESTRSECLEWYADLPEQLDDPTDPKQAAKVILDDINKRVRFREIFYLHPTDQSFSEMLERKSGRCEDITNMQLYATRANAIAVASDYTPYWANRDNNHAWMVVLGPDGRGNDHLFNQAGKIYRKTFAKQNDCLATHNTNEEKLPRWLSGRHYIDVTDQYYDTIDISVDLREPPEETTFAYICVFNNGEWKPIHWTESCSPATFANMARNVAYLPAWFIDGEIVPAADPLILHKCGKIETLKANPDKTTSVEVSIVNPNVPDFDTKSIKPAGRIKPGKTYELFYFDKGWQSLGKQIATENRLTFENIPSGGLYWIAEDDSRKLERIFTIEDGKQIMW